MQGQCGPGGSTANLCKESLSDEALEAGAPLIVCTVNGQVLAESDGVKLAQLYKNNAEGQASDLDVVLIKISIEDLQDARCAACPAHSLPTR